MGQDSDNIKRHIEETRNRLGQNLNDLEYRVKTVTDWRTYVNKYPWGAVGAAFLGGLMLAMVTAPRRAIRT